MERRRETLNGYWQYSLPGGDKEERWVPSSHFCVGDSLYERGFAANPDEGQRLLLCFEGIAYEATVAVNGHPVGTMLPYVPYRFDVTSLVSAGAENTLMVALRDITAAFGPTEGWESYGGIIRDVFLEYVPQVSFADIFFRASFSQGYGRAHGSVRLSLDAPSAVVPEGYAAVLRLYRDGACLCSADAAVDTPEAELAFVLDAPVLWSPDTPALYDLEMMLLHNGVAMDEVRERVGFKELTRSGRDLLLNGKRLVLRGVCRHDMWGDTQGFTLTQVQMETDMRMLKQLGANYVRLVHYPHHRYVVALADELGLLVSEEPGLWFSDLENPVVADAATEVMRRTVLRDRNRVSVGFWLAFNECVFTDTYLHQIKTLCNTLDPTRMVSGANFMNPETTKEVFSRHDIDFYTYHPYGHHPDGLVTGGHGGNGNLSLQDVLAVLDDRPTVFTEWGGWMVRDNPALLTSFAQRMADAAKAENGRLAGFCYWAWSDIRQSWRGAPACLDGILCEGLVDQWRKPHSIFHTMQDIFHAMELPQTLPQARVALCALREVDRTLAYRPLDLGLLLDAPEQERAWARASAQAITAAHRKRNKHSVAGPCPGQAIRAIDGLPVRICGGRPLLLTAERAYAVAVGEQVAQVCFIGQVTWPFGWPTRGGAGSTVARYTLRYGDGTRREYPQRVGIEVAAANMLWGPSRIDPAVAGSQRAFVFAPDQDWEVYQARCLCVPCDANRVLESIVLTLEDSDFPVVLFGITVGRMSRKGE